MSPLTGKCIARLRHSALASDSPFNVGRNTRSAAIAVERYRAASAESQYTQRDTDEREGCGLGSNGSPGQGDIARIEVGSRPAWPREFVPG